MLVKQVTTLTSTYIIFPHFERFSFDYGLVTVKGFKKLIKNHLGW